MVRSRPLNVRNGRKQTFIRTGIGRCCSNLDASFGYQLGRKASCHNLAITFLFAQLTPAANVKEGGRRQEEGTR